MVDAPYSIPGFPLGIFYFRFTSVIHQTIADRETAPPPGLAPRHGKP
jgi:hypothetical protein